MTFAKIAYVSCRDLQSITDKIEEKLSDQISIHYDGAEEKEVWVEVDNDNTLDILLLNGCIDSTQKEEIISNNADTVLFY